jgi:hypothetical protein
MPNATFYRKQAERCLRLARDTSEKEKATLLAMARDYLRLAEELDSQEEPPSKV